MKTSLGYIGAIDYTEAAPGSWQKARSVVLLDVQLVAADEPSLTKQTPVIGLNSTSDVQYSSGSVSIKGTFRVKIFID